MREITIVHAPANERVGPRRIFCEKATQGFRISILNRRFHVHIVSINPRDAGELSWDGLAIEGAGWREAQNTGGLG
jgi:hypothetical protein